jgi:hypothetical protein
MAIPIANDYVYRWAHHSEHDRLPSEQWLSACRLAGPLPGRRWARGRIRPRWSARRRRRDERNGSGQRRALSETGRCRGQPGEYRGYPTGRDERPKPSAHDRLWCYDVDLGSGRRPCAGKHAAKRFSASSKSARKHSAAPSVPRRGGTVRSYRQRPTDGGGRRASAVRDSSGQSWHRHRHEGGGF